MGHLLRKAMLVGVLAVGAVAVALVALLVAPIESSRAAQTFTVVDPADAPDAQLNGVCASTNMGLCTLRAAIQEAEFVAGDDIVVLSTGLGDYRLTIPPGAEATGPPSNATGDLDISTNVTVNGAGPDAAVIDGTGTHRIFDVHESGILTLNGVTLQNGIGDFDGATSHVHGGAIHNHGEIRLDHVLVASSSATTPGWGGGGITNATKPSTGVPAVAQLSNVTVARNSTGAQGGGIENRGGELRMLNVTIAENSAPAGMGGGIFLVGSTSTMSATATLVADNTGGDCQKLAGTVTSGGANLAEDGSCGFTNPTDRSGDPGFDTNALGPPLFYPLLATSQAVDTGSICQPNDIRGVSRPQDGNGDGVALCDTGSYEREAPPPAPTCNGQTATIYVNAQGVIVGGPNNGQTYGGKLNGTPGNDVMVGTAGNDEFAARAGNDLICGGDGNDELEGGPGNDRLFGEAGNDVMAGGRGNDTMTGGLGADRFQGGAGSDTATDFTPAQGDTKTGVEVF